MRNIYSVVRIWIMSKQTVINRQLLQFVFFQESNLFK